MTGGTHSQGAFGQVFLTAAGDTAPHSYESGDGAIRLEFASCTLGVEGRIIGMDAGITGTRSRRADRARHAAPTRRGWIEMPVSAADFANLLPILGFNNESPSGTFNQTNAVPYFGVLVDTDYSTMEFKDCMVNRWVLRGRAPSMGESGQPDLLLLQMEVYASDDADGTALPSSPPALTSQGFYVFSDLALTLGGSARDVQEFMLFCDFGVFAKMANALTVHSMVPTRRICKLRAVLPWNSTNADLYDIAIAGAAGSAVLTNSGLSTTFTLDNVKWPRKSPVIRGKTEIPLEIEADILDVDSDNDEIKVVNDATP